MPSYAVITPARNEAANLGRVARSLLRQSIRPSEWIIVDDASTDETVAIARELCDRHGWIRLMPAPRDATERQVTDGRRSGRDIAAFHTGLAALSEQPDFVVKLDADVSFSPDYFGGLFDRFDKDSVLGIAGGLCYEWHGDAWRPRYVTEGHVRGATRVWRWECLQLLLPLEERLGWDGVDELKAATLGWRTQSFDELPFFHHRKLAAREGSRWRGWALIGESAHYLGSRPSYVFLRALNHARREVAALGLVWGYLDAAIRRRPRCPDRAVRAHIRRHQRARNLPLRAREALGKRSPSVAR